MALLTHLKRRGLGNGEKHVLQAGQGQLRVGQAQALCVSLELGQEGDEVGLTVTGHLGCASVRWSEVWG